MKFLDFFGIFFPFGDSFLENGQDLLLQTGKDKEKLEKKVTECNMRMQNYENENFKLEQENQYFKAENKIANEHIDKVNLEHQK